ncbi:alpha/beta hydrolase [Rhodococcus ruber BKS 20-38]|uniref:Alpha/beta hydrolase n=1 Tax=Rhodococcus ruber BKS 20-38 TaxID=1278076 RepID=M2XI62_9NOCA|nr:hypothetical protein [Rhodococcus ruber]EME60696.1 alpha/beta hydrolase [Rhodococcus ruber BKS 20-38]
MLLIPGAFLGTESMSAWMGAFTATRSVTVFDQQGHGCTPDTARPNRQISDAQMRSITAKAMVIVGDADGVKPERAPAMFRLLGGGDEEAAATGMLPTVPRARLVVLPATSHLGILGDTEVLVPTVTAFLDDVPPVTPELFRADDDRQAAT